MKWFLFTYRAENYFYYFLDIHFKAISQFPICDLELISKNMFVFRFLDPFAPNLPFLYTLKTWKNLTVFWCFQGVEKWCIGSKWVDQWLKIQYNWYYSSIWIQILWSMFFMLLYFVYLHFFLFWEVSQGIKETDQGIKETDPAIIFCGVLAFIMEMWNFISGWQIWFW